MSESTPKVEPADRYIAAAKVDLGKLNLDEVRLDFDDLLSAEFDGPADQNLGLTEANELTAVFSWQENPKNVEEVWLRCRNNYRLPDECRSDFCAAIQELVDRHGLELEIEGGFLVQSLAEIIKTGEITLTEDALRRFEQAVEEKPVGPSWGTIGLAGLLGAGAMIFGQMLKNHRAQVVQEEHV